MLDRIGIISLALLAVMFAAVPSVMAQEAEEASPYDTAIGEAQGAMMRDPSLALARARDAESLVIDAANDPEAVARALWLQAEATTRLGRPEEATPIARQALELLGENPEPTKLYGDLLTAQARAMKLTGEHGEALEVFLQAFDVYVAVNEPRSQAIVLQSIGSIYNDARQYQRAVDYYADAIERYQDTNLDLAAYNNLGNAHTALGETEPALDYFQRALAIAEEMDSGILQARILNNIASLYIANERWAEADATIEQAIAAAGDPAGAEWGRFLFGVRAQTEFGRGQLQPALRDIERVFAGVDLEATNQHFMDFHETAARIYAALGRHETALAHFEAFKRLDDDARDFAASANSALIAAQFDFAEQELQIEHLRAETLEADLALARSQTQQRNLIMAGVLALLVLSLISGFFVIRSMRERHKITKRLLETDSETGLPTRHALVRERERMIAEGGNPTFVAVFDMARGSHIENLLGFRNFVKIQRELGERLCEIEGILFVALVGPGEFGVILDTDEEIIIEDEVAHYLDKFCRSIPVNGIDVDIDAVVGLACDEDSELAVRHAMIAATQAKTKLTAFAVYDPNRFGNQQDTLSLMTRMSAAMKSGDFDLHFQPKLNLRTGRVQSVEALSRWTDPEIGPISPDRFVPQAEQTGRIRELTEWTVSAALTRKRELAQAGFDLDIAINISGRLVSDEDFGDKVLHMLGHGISGITFEITETSVMHHPEAAMRNLDRWVDAGIRLAIDDYGAGLSSLSYLKRLPCQELKMDRMFVQDLQTSAKDRILIKSTIDLAHNLGLQVTAEGVEDEMTLSALQALGCDYVQGYLLSKAMPAGDLVAFLRARQDAGDTSGGAAKPDRSATA